MIRHIEFTIDLDLACWGEKEDFETDASEYIKESVEDFVLYNPDDLIPHIKIKKVWYEED